ncbi:hypothetical protein EYS14_01545 [Alteromonadaceae bacterium M269]|nr:hypothetical protein EYS14_01545 [Alteromonadaceae bacterium M269]
MSAALNVFDPNKFMKVSDWIKREFVPGSGPNPRVIRRRIDLGELNGFYDSGGTYIRSDQRCFQSAAVNDEVNELIKESM